MLYRLAACWVFLFTGAELVRADAIDGRRLSPQSVQTPYSVTVVDGENQIIIPKNLLRDLRAAADSDGETTRAAVPTIMAGLLLTLSFGCGGVWLARYRGQLRGTGLAVALTAVALFGSSVACADAGFGKVRPATDALPIKVNIAEKGDTIAIQVSKKVLEDLTKK